MRKITLFDTNVIVSALLSKNSDSPTVIVLREVLNGRIIPLYHQNILEEYFEVLSREKFHLDTAVIKKV